MIRWWFRGSVQVPYNNAINAAYCGQRAFWRIAQARRLWRTLGGTHTRVGAFDQFLIELRSKSGTAWKCFTNAVECISMQTWGGLTLSYLIPLVLWRMTYLERIPRRGDRSKQPPNTRLQRTPLRVEQDRAFFSAKFCYNVVAINWWRRR